MKTIEEINFREYIAETMFELRKFKPIDFDLLLFQQLFMTSMKSSDPVMSMSIKDFLWIFNMLND